MKRNLMILIRSGGYLILTFMFGFALIWMIINYPLAVYILAGIVIIAITIWLIVSQASIDQEESERTK